MKKYLLIILTIFIVLIPLTLSVYIASIPSLKLNGDENQVIGLNEEYKESFATAKNLFGNTDYKIKTEGKVDTEKTGKYKIKYTYKNHLIKKSITRTVEVVDKESPVITLTGGNEVLVCPGKEYEELGYSASDNLDGDLTNKVDIIKTNDLIKYEVKDSFKNKTVVERKIKYEDKEAPVITLSGNESISIPLGQAYKEPGYTVSDNCDGDLTSNVEVTNNVNSNKIGNYEVAYKVKDKAGNETTKIRKIRVYQNKAQITPAKGSVIYLTFDDGPSSTITPKVLDILKETGVKATFFVTGKSDSLNYLIKRAYDEGHTIALHTYTHVYSQVYQSETAYFNDLYRIRDKVKNIIGVESNIIRFPGGSSNTVSRNYNKGIMSRLVNQVTEKGFIYFDWNVGSGDASTGATQSSVYNSVIKGVSPNKTNVVLMHDFENNYKTLNALRDIINTCKSNGYTFAPITSSTPQVTHGVNN